MRRFIQIVQIVIAAVLLAGPAAYAKPAKKKATSQAAPGKTVNACGCYADGAGRCFCGKGKGKCACPGECEPKGCEEKRAKELDKEIAAETKKAAEADKKQRQAEKSKK
jgi:hypothetical protein